MLKCLIADGAIYVWEFEIDEIWYLTCVANGRRHLLQGLILNVFFITSAIALHKWRGHLLQGVILIFLELDTYAKNYWIVIF